MTWLIFDGKLMCAETGAMFFVSPAPFVNKWGVVHTSRAVDEDDNWERAWEIFSTEAEAIARFEGLKKLLLPKEEFDFKAAQRVAEIITPKFEIKKP